MKKLSILWIAILSVAVCLSCSDRTVNGTIRKYESNVKSQLQQNLSATNLTWPISKIAIVVLKEERKLEVWGKNDESQPWSIIKIYDVLAASGDKGPKLKEGDRQVPEGIYQLEGLNPKSYKSRPIPDVEYIHKEITKKGVTFELLWQEYKEMHPDGYGCRR